MRQFKEQTRKVKEVTSIVCNKCGRVIPVVEGVPQEDVLTVDKRWGYFSEKDNRRDHFDLCESCYDELTRNFKIKNGRGIEENYVRCMFVRNRRDDAAAVQVAYIPDGALQWKQSSGRLWRGNTDCDKRKGMEF